MVKRHKSVLDKERERRGLMVDIKIYGGENEIGGNKILISQDKTNILLDFGMSFHQYGEFFAEFSNPRKCVALTDFFEFDLLPDIKGVYRQDYLKHMQRPQEERAIDALFLSHAHADHAQYIHFLRKDIPIYCSEVSKLILQSLESTSAGGIKDFITICDAFTFYETRSGTKGRVTRKQKDYVYDRPYSILNPGNQVDIDKLKVEMIPVDHSLPGACGIIIYSDEGNLVYTGDIRFHGTNRSLSENFVEKAKEARPKWLLCEGTRIDKDDSHGEDFVKQKITDIAEKSEGIIFVEHSIRDIDRVNTIYESARANDREFVISLKLACLIDILGEKAPFKLEDVKILIPKKRWGLIGRTDVEDYQIERDYSSWERKYISSGSAITSADLRDNQPGYIVSMNMWEITQLVDIEPKDAIWVKSSCLPFSDEMELDEERKEKILNHFKIPQKFAHASGHANGNEIRDMIKKINPEILIPIHTIHPDLFQN